MGSLIFVGLTLLLLHLCSLAVDGKIVDNKCDIFDGRWVYDESEWYPVYNTSRDCPFIIFAFNCQRNGRPNTDDYHKYRWQPTACNLPRFDGEDFLSRLRGKRLMFVGDSIGGNQYQSLVCMLHKSVPQASYKSNRTGDVSRYNFRDYKAKVMFDRAAFLVDLINTTEKILKIDSINNEKGDLWRQADILVFNSRFWWFQRDREQHWDFMEYRNIKIKDMDRYQAYEIGLTTWAKWIDADINRTKTKVFFQGVSPRHNDCRSDSMQARSPIYMDHAEPECRPRDRQGDRAEIILERVISKMSTPVYLLNVTTLSKIREDGHPSYYGIGHHFMKDCVHWCLPGIPDTWNYLLYAALIQS